MLKKVLIIFACSGLFYSFASGCMAPSESQEKTLRSLWSKIGTDNNLDIENTAKYGARAYIISELNIPYNGDAYFYLANKESLAEDGTDEGEILGKIKEKLAALISDDSFGEVAKKCLQDLEQPRDE